MDRLLVLLWTARCNEELLHNTGTYYITCTLWVCMDVDGPHLSCVVHLHTCTAIKHVPVCHISILVYVLSCVSDCPWPTLVSHSQPLGERVWWFAMHGVGSTGMQKLAILRDVTLKFILLGARLPIISITVWCLMTMCNICAHAWTWQRRSVATWLVPFCMKCWYISVYSKSPDPLLLCKDLAMHMWD